MSAPFVIPFNFDPVSSVAVTSAGYTVPAGKYAYANIFTGNGNVLINGSVVFGNSQLTSNTYSTTSTATSEITIVTAPSNTSSKHSFTGTTAVTVAVTFRQRRGGSLVLSFVVNNSTNTVETYVLPGDTFTCQSVATAVTRTVILATPVTSKLAYSAWLTAGDVLNFTSDSPVAVEGLLTVYNKIS